VRCGALSFRILWQLSTNRPRRLAHPVRILNVAPFFGRNLGKAALHQGPAGREIVVGLRFQQGDHLRREPCHAERRWRQGRRRRSGRLAAGPCRASPPARAAERARRPCLGDRCHHRPFDDLSNPRNLLVACVASVLGFRHAGLAHVRIERN
jgi:hypothetical protein